MKTSQLKNFKMGQLSFARLMHYAGLGLVYALGLFIVMLQLRSLL